MSSELIERPREVHEAGQHEAGVHAQGQERPLQLLMLSSDTFPPQRVDVTVLFGEELAGRGHRIDLILQSEAPCRHAYRTSWDGGWVWVAPADRGASLLRRLRKHLLGIWHDARLFRLVRSGRYDAIAVKDKFLSGLLALLAGRLYGTPFIYWLSYPFPEHYLARARDGTAPYPLLYRIRGEAFRLLLYRALLPAADHVFVQSEQMRRDLAAEGIALAKLTAVPMGIKLESIAATREPARRRVMPPEERCFLYLGSLWRGRRLDFLLRVLQRVQLEVPEAKLYYVGGAEDPADEEFLYAEARRLAVDSAVVFTGHLPRSEALRYVEEADVCVSPLYPTPAFRAASPTKLIEYMAAGRPVVANTHPEQQLLIEESGCGYCVPYDEDAFAQPIVALLRAPQLARELGERGRCYALEHRTYASIADVVERQMRRVISGDPP